MKAWRTICATLLVAAAAAAAPAAAAPGDLDHSFGVGGEVLARPGEEPPPGSTQPFGFHAEASAVITLRDGKLLAGGVYRPSGQSIGALARFGPDGRPDSTFGDGGIALVPVQVTEDPVEQSDGKLLVAGGAVGEDGRPRLAVVRVLRDGRLDPSWAGDGVAETQIAPQGSYATAVALGAGGRVYATGGETWRAGNPPYAGHAIARFLPDGSLDTAFADGGVLRTGLGDRMGVPSAIQGMPRGGVLIGGSVVEDGRELWMLARYDSDGSPHRGFGGDGVVKAAVGAPGPAPVGGVADMLIDPAGRVVTAGSSNRVAGFTPIFTLARFDGDGRLDRGFGGRGWVQAPLERGSDAYAIVRQPDGKLVAAGRDLRIDPDHAGPAASAPALVRFTPSGSLDRGFGDGGVVGHPFGTRFRGAYGLTLQDDGKLVVAGGSQDCKRRVFALLRYLGDGGRAGIGGPPIRLCSKDELVDAEGALQVGITCPAIFEACKGRATLRVGRGRARASFALRGGSLEEVRLRLRARERRALARRGRLRARVTFEARDRSGRRRKTHTRLVLHRAG